VNPFDYVRAENAGDALAAVAGTDGARYIAGGTTLLDLMKDAVERPPLVVDINPLPLRQIELRDGGLYLGALARMSDVAASPLVRAHHPAIAQALDDTASPQLRNMGTIGGNLLQRTRCPYFRDVATPCNKRAPGSGCGAIGGVNRSAAVLGTSDACIATHPSDLAVPLTAFDAVIHVSNRAENDDRPIAQFFHLPGATPQRETSLEPGALITGVTIPLLPAGTRSTYLKVRDRAQYEFALASAAVAITLENDTISKTRIALGGVATIPWRAPEAEHVLEGAAPTPDTFQNAAAAALAGARGSGQNDFKTALARRTLVRALAIAAGLA
jgi:xanthine dehydrogenase YagS FAD-binding subunit